MLLLLFSLAFFQLSLSCPLNMLSGLSDDPCYQLVTTPAPFLTAEYNCAQMGGHLASVGNAFLNSYLNQNAQQQFSNYDSYWLGGSSNVFVSGKWVWTDGETFTYNNWAAGRCSLRSRSVAQLGVCPRSSDRSPYRQNSLDIFRSAEERQWFIRNLRRSSIWKMAQRFYDC